MGGGGGGGRLGAGAVWVRADSEGGAECFLFPLLRGLRQATWHAGTGLHERAGGCCACTDAFAACVRVQVAAFFEQVDFNDPLALLTPLEVRVHTLFPTCLALFVMGLR